MMMCKNDETCSGPLGSRLMLYVLLGDAVIHVIPIYEYVQQGFMNYVLWPVFDFGALICTATVWGQ